MKYTYANGVERISNAQKFTAALSLVLAFYAFGLLFITMPDANYSPPALPQGTFGVSIETPDKGTDQVEASGLHVADVTTLRNNLQVTGTSSLQPSGSSNADVVPPYVSMPTTPSPALPGGNKTENPDEERGCACEQATTLLQDVTSIPTTLLNGVTVPITKPQGM